MVATTLPGVLLFGVAGSRPAANAVANGTLYSATDTGTVTQSDGVSTWSTFLSVSATGIPATIFDAAGDLIVASAADTAAKLTMGNPGGAVSRVNGAVAWNAGTAFPTAATGDRYWRTDLGVECYYDGTNWLTATLYREDMQPETNLSPQSATFANLRWAWDGATNDVWVDRIELMTYHSAPTGTNYWSIQPIKGTTAESESNLGSPAVTSSDTSNNWTVHNVTVGALLGTTYRYIRLLATKNASATAVYVKARVVYRVKYT